MRKILFPLLLSLLTTCFVEVPQCFLFRAVSPSVSLPPFAALAELSPASCPPETVDGETTLCSLTYFKYLKTPKIFHLCSNSHLPGIQFLRQRHLVFDGVEKLLSE